LLVYHILSYPSIGANGSTKKRNWNKQAVSIILERESFKDLEDAIPNWRAKQMLWPSEEDIDSK